MCSVRKYLESNGQKLQILSILIFFVMVIGIVTGSIFYMKTGDGREIINGHLSDIFRAAAETSDKLGAAKNYLFEAAVSCFVIFISAYFKLGALTSLGVVLRKGFITGFTAAAAAGTYGVKGIALVAATSVDLVISVIILVIFSAVSVTYSIEKEKNSKKFLIFFAIFSISIFCVISFARGFLSTTFMNLIYPKFN